MNYMVSLSDDLNQIVVLARGTKEAGAWYLLSNKTQLTALGRRFPHLDPAQSAEMTYVSNSARDGLTIPALLTLPQTGRAPHPKVIMPHGGPWARDSLRWHPWVQFLANRDYAVLQPQYRGSLGWGQAFWRIANGGSDFTSTEIAFVVGRCGIACERKIVGTLRIEAVIFDRELDLTNRGLASIAIKCVLIRAWARSPGEVRNAIRAVYQWIPIGVRVVGVGT